MTTDPNQTGATLPPFNLRDSLQRLGTLGLASLVFVLLCCIAARAWWAFELFTHASTYWFLAAVALAALLIATRAVKRAAACILLAVYFGWGAVPYLVSEENSAGSERIRVLHFNVLHNNRQHEQVAEYLTAQDADIVVIQELDPTWRKALDAVFASYPHRAVQLRHGADGQAILSRFPLSDIGHHPEPDAEWPVLSATATTPHGPLRLVTIHPPPPVRQHKAELRNSRLDLAARLSGGDGARLLLGDFNCTPWSPYFRELCATTGLRDAARGQGFVRTWYPTALPLGIPIDHVLHSEELRVGGFEVGPDLGSDHRPIVVDIQF